MSKYPRFGAPPPGFRAFSTWLLRTLYARCRAFTADALFELFAILLEDEAEGIDAATCGGRGAFMHSLAGIASAVGTRISDVGSTSGSRTSTGAALSSPSIHGRVIPLTSIQYL